MKPTITIDARMLGFTGIGTYLDGLIRHVSQCSDYHWVLLGDSHMINKLNLPNNQVSIRDCQAPIYSFREQWKLPLAVGRTHLHHSPHYNVPLFFSQPLVVTVHDVTHFRFPEFFKKGLQWTTAKLVLKSALEKAKKIISVSQSTRDDLINLFQVPESKIAVIYQGLGSNWEKKWGEDTFDLIGKKYALPENYLITVGNLKPHKNVKRLLSAFRRFSQSDSSNMELIIVGNLDKHHPELRELRELLDSKGIRYLNYLPAEDLPIVLGGAKALVTPSLWEGFGLPILEAFALDVPVIASRIPSHQEIIGESGFYFDPKSEEELESALHRLIREETLRNSLIRNGRKQRDLFSWNRAAEETIKVYKEALS